MQMWSFLQYICSYADKFSYLSPHTCFAAGLFLPIIFDWTIGCAHQVMASKTLYGYDYIVTVTSETASQQQHQMQKLKDFECLHVPCLNLLKRIDMSNSPEPLRWFLLIIRPKHWWALSICLSVQSQCPEDCFYFSGFYINSIWSVVLWQHLWMMLLCYAPFISLKWTLTFMLVAPGWAIVPTSLAYKC